MKQQATKGEAILILVAVVCFGCLIGFHISLSVAQANPTAKRNLNRNWIAASTTAESITGNITLARDRIMMAHKEFPLTFVRDIDKQHLYDVGKILDDEHAPPSARLYKTRISGRSRLVNGNTICGPHEDARRMLITESTEHLSLAFFSGESEPNLDYHVVDVGRYLCGTFYYIPKN